MEMKYPYNMGDMPGNTVIREDGLTYYQAMQRVAKYFWETFGKHDEKCTAYFPYVCDTCSMEIFEGSKYLRSLYFENGDVFTSRRHMGCKETHSNLLGDEEDGEKNGKD
jgi:hypothetical protein